MKDDFTLESIGHSLSECITLGINLIKCIVNLVRMFK